MKRSLTMILALCLRFCAVNGSMAYAEKLEKTDDDFTVGKTVDNCYENSFFGFRLELGEEFVFASPDELASMVGATAEMFTSETYRDQMMNLDMFYDMQASDELGLKTVVVLIQNIGKVYGMLITPETYVKGSMKEVALQLEDAGFTDVNVMEKKAIIDGTEIPGIYVTSKVQGFDYYSHVLVFKQGGYLSTVTFSTFLEDSTADLMESFSFLA